MPRTPSNSSKGHLLQWTAFALVAIIALIITYVLARDMGIRDGQRSAREQIMQQDSITAGPERLIQQ